MEKFLLILFFIIKILVIVVAPIVLYIFRNNNVKKFLIYIEIIALIVLIILYSFGFSFMVDSTIVNIFNLKYLNESDSNNTNKFDTIISYSSSVESIEADSTYRNYKNEPVYYYNAFDYPLSTKKISCDDDYDYFKYYSNMVTSTATLLSTYFDKNIDPIEIYNKANKAGLIKCGERINKDKFFAMISNEYKVNFIIAPVNQLDSYLRGGNVVLLETIGNGNLSCNESYFVIYNITNSGDYLLLDPSNKSYEYICPDGSKGFGNILKSNYNEQQFSYSSIISDTSRFIVIGGTRK